MDWLERRPGSTWFCIPSAGGDCRLQLSSPYKARRHGIPLLLPAHLMPTPPPPPTRCCGTETATFCLSGTGTGFRSESNLKWNTKVKTEKTALCRVSDPHWFNADPDPAFFLIADPDPVFFLIADCVWWPKIGKNLQLEI